MPKLQFPHENWFHQIKRAFEVLMIPGAALREGDGRNVRYSGPIFRFLKIFCKLKVPF